MKEKTKAFYKAVFKYWLKKSVIPFVAAIALYFITGFIIYFSMGIYKKMFPRKRRFT